MNHLSNRFLHIVSFDVPSPPDYGGVVDVFYKVKALADCGVKIILHCYQYGRPQSEILSQICFEVNYYPRLISKGKLFSRVPYIVCSRSDERLMFRMQQDQYPILMEGLHTTSYLGDERLKNRFVIVRTHNVEHDYYQHLARTETNLFKKSYYYSEAIKLEYYESVLKFANAIAAISPADTKYFQHKYFNTFYLPAFHPNQSITAKTGPGTFAFYHGNLAVAENNEAALFLVNHVFISTNHSLVISGSKPSEELKQAVKANPKVELRSHDSPDEMLELIAEAHVNILPTFQSTGIKLKLITALFRGRFCIVNAPMIAETGLEDICIVANDAKQMMTEVNACFKKEFTQIQIDERKKVLQTRFSNKTNAEHLISILYK